MEALDLTALRNHKFPLLRADLPSESLSVLFPLTEDDCEPGEFQKVQDLKATLELDGEEHMVLRFLRARDGEMEQAKSMLEDHLAWRAEKGIDSIFDGDQSWLPTALMAYMPSGVCGHARNGCPIMWTSIPDLNQTCRIVDKATFLRYQNMMDEYREKVVIKAASIAAGRAIDKTVTVMDLANLSWATYNKPFHQWFSAANSVRETQRPESLSKVIVINAPSLVASVLWPITKQALAEKTRQKVQILGTDYYSALSEIIAPENIPQKLGGEMDDALFEKTVPAIRDIPESLFIEGKPAEELTEVTVGRASTLQVDLDVEVAGSTISWEFKTNDYDIGFGVYRKALGSGRLKKAEMMEVVQDEKKDSHVHPEEGSLVVDEAGTYVLRWDNTYSWTRSKTLLYDCNITAP